MDLVNLDSLISGIGPLDDSIARITRDSENRWSIEIGDIELVIEFDAARGLLRLVTEIGIPEPDTVLEVYQAMLIYNVAGRETGDVVIGLTGPGGSLLQLLTVPAAGLASKDLVTPVVNLAQRTVAWRQLLAGGLTGSVEAATDIVESDAFIRV